MLLTLRDISQKLNEIGEIREFLSTLIFVGFFDIKLVLSTQSSQLKYWQIAFTQIYQIN